MSIHNVWQKINPFRFWTLIPEKIRLDILYLLIIICIGLLSFGLGKLSYILDGNGSKSVEIINSPNSTSTVSTSLEAATNQALPKPTSTPVVASKQGSKWHYEWCPGAKTISSKNKITFKTVELAEKAGYTQAANCK